MERITIGALFDRVALGAEDREALVFPAHGIRWTYRDAHTRVNQLAKGLMGAGVGAGEAVALWATSRPEWVVVQLAVAKIGAALVPIAPDTAIEAVLAVLAHAQATTLLTVGASPSHPDRLAALASALPELAGARPGRLASRAVPHLKRVTLLGGPGVSGVLGWPELLAASAGITDHLLRLRQDAVDPLDPAVVQYTPGSSAEPRGVELTHQSLVNNARDVGECMRLRRRDRLCVPVPLAEPAGHVLGTLTALTHACPLVIPADDFDAGATLAAVAAERCTALHGTPGMFGAELAQRRFHDHDLSSLRTGLVITTGARPARDLLEQVIRRMHLRELTVGWGRPEATAIVTQTRADDPFELRLGTIGAALPGVEVKIVDPASRRELPRGAPGELCCRGYLVMHGYRNAPEATAAALDAEGWLATGLSATMDEQGYCRISTPPTAALQEAPSPGA